MPDIVLNIAEVDERIAAVRENLRQLVEQAAASPGAADTPSAVAPAIFRTSRRVLFDLRMMTSSGVVLDFRLRFASLRERHQPAPVFYRWLSEIKE